jgi:trimethylamine--corrinoid protein Co-methyltransferase
MEFSYSAMLSALAGANIIYGMGMLEAGLTWDFAQLVMEDEFASYLMKIIEGVPVNDETLAVDIIEEVGPGGEYLSHEDTYIKMRNLSQVNLIDRGSREKFEARGSVGITEKAYARAIDLIENHRAPALSEDLQKQLSDISEETYAVIMNKKAR